MIVDGLRNPEFRAKLVLEQLLPEVLSTGQLRDVTQKEPDASKRGGLTYTPLDIRAAKLTLTGQAGAKLPLKQPILINTRIPKGGTGKTTITGNLATAFAFMGYRVLAIDGDPQASLSHLLGVDPEDESGSVSHIGALMQEHESRREKVDLAGAVRHVYPGGMLDLIPADITLTQTDGWLIGQLGREHIFEQLVADHPEFFGQYDVVLIDSAPGTTPLTFNFMAAAHALLAVVWLDRESLRAMNLLASNIKEVNRALPGKNLQVRIVANGYHAAYAHCKESLGVLHRSFSGNIDDIVISHSSGFVRQKAILTAEAKGPLVEQDPQSFGAKQIFELARSLVTRYSIKLGAVQESWPTLAVVEALEPA